MEHSRHVGSARRSDARLSRRSLVAAGALLATLGPAAASRAFARNPNEGNIPGCVPSKGRPKKCVCFLRGTRLQTPGGDIEIERLSIGDAVTLHDGEVRTIRWIGRLNYPKAGGWSEEVLPVRIAKSALGPNMPHRDLYVSRAHLIYLNGVLIPASDIINGITISVVAPEADALQYFHVELDHHAVLVAEGAPCESFRNSRDSWRTFDNAAEYSILFGHLARPDMEPYAPIASFNGGRGALRSRLRSALAPLVDIRQPQDVARDNIEALAFMPRAA